MEAFERNVSHFNSLASVFFLCVMNVISWSLWAICPGTRQPVMKLPLQHKGKISAIWLQRLIILALIALCMFCFFLQTNNALNMTRVILFYLLFIILILVFYPFYFVSVFRLDCDLDPYTFFISLLRGYGLC